MTAAVLEASGPDKSASMKDALVRYLAERFPLLGHDIGGDTQLLEGGAIDCLGILDIVMFIENSFGISVSDADILEENFRTVDALCEFLRQKLP